MKTHNLKEAGFTLIELMVVVGIIGILVALAAPNFARYQSKARQSEAKIALAAIYGGEKSFYSEYSAYVGDLASIGYVPEGHKRFYSIGWKDAIDADKTDLIQGFKTPSSPMASYDRENIPAEFRNGCTPVLSSVPAKTDIDPQAFVAIASGMIRYSSDTSCDTWQINELKKLENTSISL